MIIRKATVQNGLGIHCRPSSVIMKESADLSCEVLVTSDNGSGQSGLKSVLELIGMGLEQGCTVTIAADGPNEAEEAEKVVELFERHYDFPPQS